MEFKVGDVIKDTDAFGTVKVMDCFRSTTTEQFCYLVKNEEDDVSFLCWEGELQSGQWSAK